jgi:hypothetical protein
MRSISKKSLASGSTYAQMFFIIAAFAIMGISSFIFVSSTASLVPELEMRQKTH